MTPGEARVAVGEESGTVRTGETAIRYEVRRSERRRKTVRIGVADGRVLVAAPAAMSAEEVGAVVRRRASWIRRQLAAPRTEAEAPPKRFVSGETLPYLGRSVRLVVDSGGEGRPAVRFDHWRLVVAVPAGVVAGVRREQVRRAVLGWYRERAADRAGRASGGGCRASVGRSRRRSSSATSGSDGGVARRGERCGSTGAW